MRRLYNVDLKVFVVNVQRMRTMLLMGRKIHLGCASPYLMLMGLMLMGLMSLGAKFSSGSGLKSPVAMMDHETDRGGGRRRR